MNAKILFIRVRKLLMNNIWRDATAVNGQQIRVKIIPLNKPQNSAQGLTWVQVGQMIELESGETLPLNLDGRSFYLKVNQLYKLKE